MGEESFGTGSNHVREKDGMWAVLAWLQILADKNKDSSKPLVTVQQIVEAHWDKYGRNYYCRYDYEGVDKPSAVAMVDNMSAKSAALVGQTFGSYTIAVADIFEYVDPVDGSIAKNQGVRFLMEDGSRIIFRLSGTAGSGATVRMYIEKYVPPTGSLHEVCSNVVGELVAFALELSEIQKYCAVEG